MLFTFISLGAQMNETHSLKLVFINRSIDVTYNCISKKEMLTPIDCCLFFILVDILQTIYCINTNLLLHVQCMNRHAEQKP